MNKHRTYWSVMGIDADNEESALSEIYHNKKECMEAIVNYGLGSFEDNFNEIISILREIKIDIDNEA